MLINKVRSPKAPMPKIEDLSPGDVFSMEGIDYLRVDGGVLFLSGVQCWQTIDRIDHSGWFQNRPDTLWNAELTLHD